MTGETRTRTPRDRSMGYKHLVGILPDSQKKHPVLKVLNK